MTNVIKDEIFTKDDDLSKFTFDDCELINVQFHDIDISNITISHIYLENVKFIECKMFYTKFFKATLKKVTFFSTSIRELTFESSNLQNVRFGPPFNKIEDLKILNSTIASSKFSEVLFASVLNSFIVDTDFNTLQKSLFQKSSLHGNINFLGISLENIFTRNYFNATTLSFDKNAPSSFLGNTFTNNTFCGQTIFKNIDSTSNTFINNSFPHSGALGLRLSMACLAQGSFIGWKKALYYDSSSPHKAECLIKLEIPEDAKRSSANGKKCRCNKAKVLEIQDMNGNTLDKETVVYSIFTDTFTYKVGQTVEEPRFYENRFCECTPGIHFFMDKTDAYNYR